MSKKGPCAVEFNELVKERVRTLCTLRRRPSVFSVTSDQNSIFCITDMATVHLQIFCSIVCAISLSGCTIFAFDGSSAMHLWIATGLFFRFYGGILILFEMCVVWYGVYSLTWSSHFPYFQFYPTLHRFSTIHSTKKWLRISITKHPFRKIKNKCALTSDLSRDSNPVPLNVCSNWVFCLPQVWRELKQKTGLPYIVHTQVRSSRRAEPTRPSRPDFRTPHKRLTQMSQTWTARTRPNG